MVALIPLPQDLCVVSIIFLNPSIHGIPSMESILAESREKYALIEALPMYV